MTASGCWLLGGLYTYKATGDETGDAYTLFQVRGPGGLATPMHRHEHEEEGFYIADGQVTVFADGVEQPAGPWRIRLRPARNAARVPSRLCRFYPPLLISPGNAGHESMFREMGEPATEPVISAPASGTVDPGMLAAIAERHGTIIVGPPPLPR